MEEADVAAYVLVNVEMGKVDMVLKEIKKLSGVVSIASTAGEFDLIVRLEVQNLETLHDLVTGKMHKIQGIVRTKTHVIAKEESK